MPNYDVNHYKEFYSSLLKSFVVDCVGVKVLVSETLLICPNFGKIINLSSKVTEPFKSNLLDVGVLDGDQCILLNFLIDGLTLHIIDTDA